MKQQLQQKDNEEENFAGTMQDGETVKAKKSGFWSVFSAILFYLLIGIFLTIVVFLLIGYRPAIVLTPSMRPAIQPGDVTVYHKVDTSELKVGDIIMFSGRDADSSSTEITNVTHRIVKLQVWVGDSMLQEVSLSDETIQNIKNPEYPKENDENWGICAKNLELPENYTLKFETHGDANGVGSNEHINVNQIQGRVEFWVPWIGIPLNFIRNNLLAFGFGALSLIMVSYVISLIIKNRDADRSRYTGV